MRTLLLSLLNRRFSDTKLNLSAIGRSTLFIALIFMCNLSFAQISSTGAGGEWSLPGTWVGGIVPTLADDVIIAAGANVTIRSPYAINNPATANSVAIDGTLTMGGGSTDMRLQIATSMQINVGGTLTNNGNGNHVINVGGNFTNNGTFIPRVVITLPTPSVGITQIVFDGATPQVIDGTSSTQTFEGITVNKSADALTVGVGIATINAASFTQTLGDFTAPATFSVSGNMTLTAGTYNAGSSTLIGGNYNRNGATSIFNSGTGTTTFNGTSQTLNGTGGAPSFYNLIVSGNLTANYGFNALNNLNISDGGTLTLGGWDYNVTGTTTLGGGVSGSLVFSSITGTKTFTGLVSIVSGATWNNSLGENVRLGSGITNNGTVTAGSGVYFIIGNSQFNGVLDLPNVTVDPTFTLTNNGTLTVSTALVGGGAFVQGANALLNLGGSEAVASFSASGANNTVNYTGSNQNVRGNFVNLGLSGSGVKTLSTSTNSITGTMTLSGTVSATTGINVVTVANLIIGAGCSVTNGNNVDPRTLTINNSLTGAGSIIQTSNSVLNINGTSTLASIDAAITGNTVNYNGASPTVVPGTYRNLVLNQSSGSATLNGNISVAGTLTLSTGNLDLGNNNLTLEATSTLSVVTPSASRMIVISGTGVMRKGVNALGPFTFPIGELTGTTEYSPITVNVTSASGFVGAYISASVVDDKSSSNNSITNYLTRYWNISQTGISNGVFTVTGTYIGSDVVGTAGNTVAAQLSGAFDQLTNGWKKFTALSGTLLATGALLADGVNSEFTGITGANPTVAINGGNVTICEGIAVPLSTTVTGIPTVVYSWSPATGLSATNVANPTATPAITTIYTVTIYDGNGISTTSNTTITVNPLPSQKVVDDPSTCIGTAVNITLTGSVTGVNYQLRLDSDDSNVGTVVAGTGGDITFSVNPASTTTYNVLATVVATTCSLEMTDKSTVTVNALPAQKVVSDPNTCIGTAVNITLTGSVTGVNYQLRLDSDDSNVGTAVAGTGGDITFSVNPAATTTYNVLATVVATTCSLEMTDKSTVTVNALPAEKAVSDPSTCIGTAVNITLTGSVTGVNYQLRLDSDDSNVGTVVAGTGGDITFSVNPASTTTYNVLATVVATTCSLEMTDKSTVTVNALPAEKAVSDPSTCIGTAVNITLTGSVTGVSYQLRLDSDDSNVGTAVAGTGGDITFSVNPAATATYNVLATVVATTCSLEMTDKSTVTVNALPALPTVANIEYCQNVVATALTATALANHTLQWYGTNSTGGTASTTAPTPVTTVVGATTYYVSQKNNTTGCEGARAGIIVTVNVLPALPTVSNIAYCQNATAAALTATALANHTLQWYGTNSTGGTASTTAPTPVTTTAGTVTYYVSQKNNTTGCESARASITVTVDALPALPTVSNISYCINATATALTATALANHTLQWYGTNSTGGTASTSAPTPVTTAAGTTTYYVSQKNNTTGCEGARASITVTVNALPIVNTPAATLQVGSIMTASPSTGGTWTSSDPGVATITNAGLITGISEGAVTFTFINTVTGCTNTTASVTVNDLPTVVIPSNKLCVGSTMTLSPGTGGTWASSDSGVATIDNTGLVTGISAGTVTFTFTETSTGLSNTTPSVTVSDIPTVSLPSDNLCVDALMTLSPSVGGAWESSDVTIATIDNTGLVTGVAAGTVSFTFTETASGCSNTTTLLTVNALPVVSAASAVCVGGTITLSPTTGGTWVSSNNSIATITNAGVVSGVSEGSVTFTFTSTTTSCSNTTTAVTVSPLPAKPTITSSNLTTATPTLTSSSDTGNQWFRNNVAIVGAINKTLTVTQSGSYTVQVTSNGCAGPVSNAVDIVITGIEDHIISGQGRVYPNPAKEVIQVDWSDFKTGVSIDVKIYDQVGRSIMTKVMTTSDNQLDVRSLVGGSYIFLARQDEKLMIQRFIKE